MPSYVPHIFQASVPASVHSTGPSLKLWHRYSPEFATPEVHYMVKFKSREINSSPLSWVSALAWIAMINEQTKDEAYYASLADLSYTLSAKEDGFQVR